MAHPQCTGFSITEASAVALFAVAAELDCAEDAATFTGALDINRQVWQTLARLAEDLDWSFPDRATINRALRTSGQARMRGNDHLVQALIDINRQVSQELAMGSNLDGLHKQAVSMWQDTGLRLDQWLANEISRGVRHPPEPRPL
ncbi:conserved hypothetical protein [Candidatus Terasakiella magnetica]|nr:conserved hypothetical protein [Candidatus Terasakiella magnetica]